MLGGIALQHAFNACLGPSEKQDRTLMLAAECGFLSMIAVAIMSIAFIGLLAVVISLLVSVIGWYYTYNAYLKLSRRDAFMWLDAKPIREPKGGD
jgi:tetrahydromethanopterin S-methyltransferase subunit C